MANEQEPGDKLYQCPACNQRVQESVLIGLNPYICPITRERVGVPEILIAQKKGFVKKATGKWHPCSES